MRIFYWNEILNNNPAPYFSKGCGISIGSFDGLHKGHRLLLSSLKQAADKDNLLCGCFTFFRPLPSIKKTGDYSGDISTLNQRLSLFEQLDMDFVIIAQFDSDFAKHTGTQFFDLLKKYCNVKLLAEGVDFRCGYKGATSVPEIKTYCCENNIKAVFVEPVFYQAEGNSKRVSSSNIRKMIQTGDFNLVESLLNRKYQLDLSQMQGTQASKNDLQQVMPPCGSYTSTVNNKQIQLTVTEDKIVLSEPAKYFSF